jgi:hypothetical protein
MITYQDSIRAFSQQLLYVPLYEEVRKALFILPLDVGVFLQGLLRQIKISSTIHSILRCGKRNRQTQTCAKKAIHNPQAVWLRLFLVRYLSLNEVGKYLPPQQTFPNYGFGVSRRLCSLERFTRWGRQTLVIERYSSGTSHNCKKNIPFVHLAQNELPSLDEKGLSEK